MPPAEQGFERALNDRYCLFLGPTPMFTNVQRLRLSADEIEPTVEEIRRHVRERKHVEAEWWVGESATPSNLGERMLELGFRPADKPPNEPEFTAMALVEPVEDASPGVEARRVQSLDEYLAATEIANESFHVPEREREAWRAIAERRWLAEQTEQGGTSLYIALVDGEPVASARVVFAEAGVLLIGGATLPSARGRGAYRALVRARWDDAVRRGTPALVVQAGAMSRPILERLGFQPVCQIRAYTDPAT